MSTGSKAMFHFTSREANSDVELFVENRSVFDTARRVVVDFVRKDIKQNIKKKMKE